MNVLLILFDAFPDMNRFSVLPSLAMLQISGISPETFSKGLTHFLKLVSIHNRPFFAIPASIRGITCLPVRSLSAVRTGQAGTQTGAAYRMYASASSLDFLGLARKFAFPDRKFTR
ncbi:MAG: hypothetical protein DRH37_02750, partial [Deltaproteobacteria bacterium]